MKQNVGSKDASIRTVLAIAIAAGGVYFKSWWGLLAIVPLATAWFSFCPIYTLLGINTCKVKK
jgi:hypothetical protein